MQLAGYRGDKRTAIPWHDHLGHENTDGTAVPRYGDMAVPAMIKHEAEYPHLKLWRRFAQRFRGNTLIETIINEGIGNLW